MVRRTTAQTRRPHVRTSPIKPIRRPTVAAAASSSAFAAARGGTTTGHRLPPPAKRARHVVGSSARLLSSGSSSSELSEPDTASSAAGGDLAAEEDDDDLESDDPLSSLSPPPPSTSAAAHQRRRARGGGGAPAAAAGPSPAAHAGKKRKRGQAEDATVVARGWQGGRRLRTSSDDGWVETEADGDEDIETQVTAESGGLSGEEVLAGEDDDDDGSFEADGDTCSVGSHLDGSLDGGSEGLDDAEGEYDLIDPTDDLLINEATREQLMRRKRAELLRLSRVAGLLDADANNSSLIKSHLVDGILATRSSRPTMTSTPLRSTSRVLSLSDASSDQDPTPQRPPIASNKRISNRSQDDDPGNEAGGEETEWEGPAPDAADKTTRRLGRRTTSGLVRTPSQAGNSKSGRALSGRSKSMGGLGGATDGRKTRFSADVEIPAALGSKRRHSSNVPVSSPTTSAPSSQSPRKTRASRARPAKPTDRRRRGSRPSPMKRNRHVAFPDVVMDPLDEEEAAAVGDSSSHRSGSGQSSAAPTRKGKEREVFKATPGRKAKTAALEALQGGESSTSASEDNYDSMTVDEDDAVVIVEGNTASKSRSRRPSTRSSHPVVSPVRPSPKRRGSSRAGLSSESQPGQMPTPPSDGDDESSDDEAAAAGTAMDEQQQPAKGDRRMLRRASSRKSIIEISEEEEEGEIAEVDMVTADGSEDEGGEGDDDEDDRTVMGDDEVPEIDLDFENATHSQLIRLRKDDLVRLCETRSLDIAGTKPQLAQALLEWRETAASSRGSSPPESAAPSSNSSQATARQHSSTRSTRRRPHAGDPVFATNAKVTPELLKGDHVHQVSQEQAATPPPSEHAHQGTGGEDLSLDLESLGLEDKEIPCDQLIKMEKVGSGGFKDVYVGKLRNRLKVAIAEFRGQLSEMDIKELKLLAEFTHPNVVKFLGVSIPEDRRIPIMMISELCENGDLFDYIRNVPAPPTKIVIKLMLDIARGLAYLHCRDKPVIHRDVKSSNILITSKVVAKVGDFGLARVKHSTRSMIRSLVGTVCYQPPEMWTAHPKYDSKVDVYSCAMVFWEMLQWHKAEKKFPWEGMNEHAIYDTVGAKKLRPSTHKLRSVWGSDVVDLMEEMWAQDPKERPSMTTVVERLVEYHRIA